MMDGFKVQTKQCATCIYKPGSTFDLEQLEQEIADKYGGFTGHRRGLIVYKNWTDSLTPYQRPFA